MNAAEASRRIIRMLHREVKIPHDWREPMLLTCTDIGTETGCFTPFVGRDEVVSAVKRDMAIAGYLVEKVTISSRVHYQLSVIAS